MTGEIALRPSYWASVAVVCTARCHLTLDLPISTNTTPKISGICLKKCGKQKN